MSAQPLVSCLMPTRDRRRFVPRAIAYFLRQDYAPRELLIVDDGEEPVGDLIPADDRIRYVRLDRPICLGAKRNLACELGRGELLAHWDDDDWHAPHRLSVQVESLLRSGAELCGLRELLHYRPVTGEAWLYRRGPSPLPWVAGCTLLYRREAWQAHRFPEVNSGEDSGFVGQFPAEAVHAIDDRSLVVALIHGGNTAPKNLAGRHWERRPLDEVTRLLAPDRAFYATLRNGATRRRAAAHVPPGRRRCNDAPDEWPAASGDAPLVSCIMPTRDRRRFIPRAIAYFLRQDYPNRELVIVDDGTDPVGDLLPAGERRIHYIRLQRRATIGAKRNLACRAARGQIVICWDDDDWYAAGRISYQVEPLLARRADVTALGPSPVLSLDDARFWTCSPELHARMFAQGVVSGTIAFWRRLWLGGLRFPDTSLAEDAAFLQALLRHGARLERLENPGVFIYLRHGANSWRFTPGSYLDAAGWRPAELPDYLPEADRLFYGLRSPSEEVAR